MAKIIPKTKENTEDEVKEEVVVEPPAEPRFSPLQIIALIGGLMLIVSILLPHVGIIFLDGDEEMARSDPISGYNLLVGGNEEDGNIVDREGNTVYFPTVLVSTILGFLAILFAFKEKSKLVTLSGAVALPAAWLTLFTFGKWVDEMINPVLSIHSIYPPGAIAIPYMTYGLMMSFLGGALVLLAGLLTIRAERESIEETPSTEEETEKPPEEP